MLSINGLAQAIRVPPNRISLIVNEKRVHRADPAARLGLYFGTRRITDTAGSYFALRPLTRVFTSRLTYSRNSSR
jgi:hypothetical protein